MKISTQIPSVNFHLWRPCNMKCGFCFATFQDIAQDVLPEGHMPREEALTVVDALAAAEFEKINFAGGEPTLCPWLPDLIRRAKETGFTTSIVTNGSRISGQWLDRVDGLLDWATVSVDTLDPEKLERLGRITRDGPMSEYDYLRVADMLKSRGIRLKVNTVVTHLNCDEDLTGFIVESGPERWKLLQVLPVKGQNDAQVDDLVVTDEQFARYVTRNRSVESEGIAVIAESNGMMTGSYVMVDPAGRFFDNVSGGHAYSRPITQVGVDVALNEVSVDAERFQLRSGLYDW